MNTSLLNRNSTYPLVSVVIPAFNHEKYVTQCLKSLIEDGYPNIEVLLMDDGSNDQTYELAQDWLKENGRYFQSTHLARQKNKGIATTLNTLIGLSQGEYVCLLASDDYLLQNGIEVRLRALKEHPEWLAVIGDCVVVDELGSHNLESGIADLCKGNKQFLLNPKLIRKELLLRWTIPGPVLLLKREAFVLPHGVGKYDESLIVEDRDYYLRLLAKSALGFVDVNVSAYRMHTTNFSSNNVLNKRRVGLLRDLGEACKKNCTLFNGPEKYILLLQSMAYKTKASHVETGRLLNKIASSILWRTLSLIYFVFFIYAKMVTYRK